MIILHTVRREYIDSHFQRENVHLLSFYNNFRFLFVIVKLKLIWFPLPALCPVQSVSNTLNCSTNKLSVSWSPGSMPVNYSATVLSPNGTALNCMTEASSCSVSTLQCGQQYTVTVKAVSSACESSSSVPTIVNSGERL